MHSIARYVEKICVYLYLYLIFYSQIIVCNRCSKFFASHRSDVIGDVNIGDDIAIGFPTSLAPALRPSVLARVFAALAP
jgi:hypothetical protein